MPRANTCVTQPPTKTESSVGNTMEGTRSKSSKPLMEKRRRARINSSLAKLKNLVVDSNRKENTRYNKLEKADILEMAVKHLKLLHQQQAAATAVSKFQAGFSECVHQVSLCIDRLDGLDSDTRLRLLGHLAACLNNIRRNESWQPVKSDIASLTSTSSSFSISTNRNPGANFVIGGERVYSGVQLVASRLSTGELAFVVPYSTVNGDVTNRNFQIEQPQLQQQPQQQPFQQHHHSQAKIEDSESVWRPW